jgi:CBS domain-containing protein
MVPECGATKNGRFRQSKLLINIAIRYYYRLFVRREILGDIMNVESILKEKGTEVATISPEATIKRAADWLRAKNVGALVVSSNDALIGLISERDIVRAFSQYGMQVKEIMTHGLISASLGDDLTHLMHLMTRHRVRHIPVLRTGKLAGIVSIGDLVKHRLDDLELEASVLRDVYIASH